MNKFLAFVFSFFMIVAVQAQMKRSVSGYFLDRRTKGPADEVPVQLINKETKKKYTAITDDEGKFLFKNVKLEAKDTVLFVLSVASKDYKPENFLVKIDTKHKGEYKMSKTNPFQTNLKVTWLFNWGDSGKEGTAEYKEHYWSHFTAKVILVIYAMCLILVFIYSLIQLSLSIAYARNRKKKAAVVQPEFNPETALKVTVQLPMYNEMYVAERIIETCAAFDYPRDKFDIQVLDDSTDETKDLIAKKVAEIAATGVQIEHIHRVDRTGYKAGALDAAMDRVKGEFIAIFDADFVPDKDWLQKTMPHFEGNPDVGVVQTRWGHLNKSYSLLTELQAFGLNGHFAAEQVVEMLQDILSTSMVLVVFGVKHVSKVLEDGNMIR